MFSAEMWLIVLWFKKQWFKKLLETVASPFCNQTTMTVLTTSMAYFMHEKGLLDGNSLKTSECRKPFHCDVERNSSYCAGGNVNWTANLKSSSSEPSEIKHMCNVNFLMSHENKVCGADIIIYSK